jgi:hypothetical protein
MKKTNYAILAIVLLLTITNVSAQSKVVPSKGDIVKINLTSLLFKNISLQYEHTLSPKTSLALGISLMPKTGLPFASSLKDQYGSNADAERAIETTKLSNFAITPEYRFYFSGKAPNGFYLAPFVRYQHMSLEQDYTFTASNNKQYTPHIVGSINNIGAGLLAGVQWGKNITLDWWIAGPLIGSMNGSLSGTDPKMSELSNADRAKLETDIEATNIPLTKIEATVGQTNVDVKLSGPYAGIRAFGFALGFRF